MEYFREEINLTDGRKEKRKPPLGEVYKDVEVFRSLRLLELGISPTALVAKALTLLYPGPLGNLGFPIFPKSTEIDSADFGSHIGSRARQSFAAKLPKRNLLVMFKRPLWWLRMLIEELHWSFFFGEIIVYGVSQGLSKGLGSIDQCCNGFWLQETTLFHIRW
ncbi:hypothetical protein DY000_02058895 [Brassica cretica]|uniref:Uncharacterized protein n=1 Tax=Brassica cretica TaxID=69181 RepID=A0ABQ7AR85_BRACR|nr:hypothetical protein DY000_02058895 [Brassica cretica]